ncbi:Mitochondrial import receptor subunit TOM70-like [Oopsacas minuta]|uniref:Mitochondrial import receptor subunit TOM70-like n=1 Tax=Oopsacas minuta TaxID=111878 RepID=A0AAV7K2V9_9METZ|nr:Mitochondrial import receptor subunit TOM70-like [Oopsacas minuta]
MDVQEVREALEYLEKAIAMDPDNGMLYVYRAQCKLASKGGSVQQGLVENNPHMMEATNQALEELEYAIKIDNQCSIAMEVLSTMYSQKGEPDRAIQYLEMAIKYARTIQEMTNLQTFLLILNYQPEINKEILACGLDPETLQNSLLRQQQN